ncbi:MAG TPA: hypothetical protein VIL20_20815 [Sandaracinaceae bacterium]
MTATAERRLLLACLLGLGMALGCGARTALSSGEPPRDAGADAHEPAGGFPCLWSLGERVELGRGERFAELTGAVHPTRDLVAVMATRGEAERVGTIVTLDLRPERLVLFAGLRGEIFTGASAWLRQDGEACALVEHDDEFAEVARAAFGPRGARCAMSQTNGGRVEAVPLGPDGGLAFSMVYPGPVIEGVAPVAGTEAAVMVRDPDRGALFVLEDGGAARIVRVRADDGAIDEVPLGRASLASAVLDRVSNRALILYFDDGWRLVRAPWDGPLELAPHADVRSMRRPIGRMRATDSEALVPLSDGTVAIFPLPASPVRFTEPVEPGRMVEAMEIVLRPGESAGGLLYAHREPSGEAVLVFRALVCNR